MIYLPPTNQYLMKIILTTLLLLPLLFLSCKKEDNRTVPKPENELVKVKFRTAEFEKTITPYGLLSSTSANRSGSTERAKITNLVLLVYDVHNRLVLTKENFTATRDSYLPVEGSFNFDLELPKGEYRIGLVGHNRQYGGLIYTFDEREFDNHQLRVDGAVSSMFDLNIVTIRDSYYYPYRDITIKSDTTFAPFKMERLTARLELEILDEIPSEVAYILVGGDIPMSIFPFSQTKSSISREGYISLYGGNSIGPKNVVLSSSIYPHFNGTSNTHKIQISMRNKDGRRVGYKAIDNVILKPNTITKLSGKLFSDESGGARNAIVSEARNNNTNAIHATF